MEDKATQSQFCVFSALNIPTRTLMQRDNCAISGYTAYRTALVLLGEHLRCLSYGLPYFT